MDRVRVGLPVSGMRALPFMVALLWVLCAQLSSCSGEDKRKYVANVDPETTPTMTTTDVSTLISDSGIVRYRVQAPVWYVYDEAKEPKWTFPQSLHLESFDDMFNKDATIDCDSATYLTNVQIWRLDGNVRVVNMAGEKFLTEQLFWDQRKQSVYSDSFIQIIRADRIMEGYGFVSNESMTNFAVKNVSAILPVEMMNGEAKQPASAAQASDVSADSAAAVTETRATAASDSALPPVRRPQRLRRQQPKPLQ